MGAYPRIAVNCSSSAPGWPYQVKRLKVRPATKPTRFTNPLVSRNADDTPSSSK
jgi:hypothetical protein